MTEQKRPDRCVLTNSPLRPGSTFNDGFSKVISQRIAITFENPSINVETGSKGVSFVGLVKTQPSGHFCLMRLYMFSKKSDSFARLAFHLH